MRYCTLASLCFALLGATYAAEKPIPQDVERREKSSRDAYAWNQKTLAGAYEKIGKRDQRWDKPANEAMEAAARFYSGLSDPHTRLQDIYAPARKAVEAGCDDPLVLSLYARASLGSNFPVSEEFVRRILAAATAMESSKYPPVRRASTLLMTGLNLAYHKSPTDKIRKEAFRFLDAAVGYAPYWLENLEHASAADHEWYQVFMEASQGYKALLGDYKIAFDRVDSVLAKYPRLKGKRLAVKGDFFIDWAWEGRGSGFANTVSPDGWKLLRERMTEARSALEEAWALMPEDPVSATKMLNVELALGGGNRAEMEKWFERAMKAESNNYQACLLKMEWLDTKWHGTPEDLLAFGHACRDTRNWASRLPLLLPEARRRMMRTIPAERRSDYFKTAEIWDEVNGVYSEYLKRYPNNYEERSKFAGFCYICAKYPEAHEQFIILGDNLVFSDNFKEKWMKQVRAYVAGAAKKK